MGEQKVRYELKDTIAWIVMNDPATLNSAGIPMAEAIAAALARAAKEARCAVLTGEGRGFCSGFNLSQPELLDDPDFDVGSVLESHFNALVTQMRELPIPLVTSVNGAAAGIGASFALLGDIIVAGESAYFLQAFRRIGLVPDGGATYLLTRAVGRARAMEMMLLGERISAAKALEWGLINRCVPDADLKQVTETLAKDLANGPKSLAMIRKLVWDGLDKSWDGQIDAERVMQRDAGRTKDFREGVGAFLNKRPAQFSGE